MWEHTTAFVTPKGDCISHNISIRKFKGSETSYILPQGACTWCCWRRSQRWQLTCNSFSTVEEKAHCFQRYHLPLTALYPKEISSQSGQIGEIAHFTKENVFLSSDGAHLTLRRPTNRCSFSQFSSLIDSAFCFNRSSRYSCPRFAKSDSEKE